MKDFRDRLRTEKHLIPFHRDFDNSRLLKELADYIQTQKTETLDTIKSLIASCQFFSLFNQNYLYLLHEMNRNIDHMGLSYDKLMEVMVAQNNGSHIYVLNQFRKEFGNRKDIHFSDTFAHRTKSIDPGIGEINTGGGLATLIDVLQIAMNSLKNRKDSMPDQHLVSDQESMFYLNLFIKISNIYFGLKNLYESIVWSGGRIEAIGDRKFRVAYADKEQLRLEEIGRFRLQQSSLATYFKLAELIGRTRNPLTLNFEWNKHKRKGVRIGQVSLNAGYIECKLTNGDDVDELDEQLSNYAAMKTYYGFLENNELPKLHPLQLWDILLLFHLVQQLFKIAADLPSNEDDVFRIEDLLDYPFRIKRKDLEQYLSERTTYQSTTISRFIDLMTTGENDWISFWNCPFIQQSDDLLLPLLTVTGPNLFYLIDHWLDKGGYSLDTRGIKLEEYITQNLQQQLDRKGYYYKICNRKKFQTKTKEKEEIDLIINLRDIVIIGEIKCIRYPMEIRDYFNNRERLTNGCNQIVRKSAYLQNNAEEFKKDIGDIAGKKIIAIVITNYPIFAGTHINNIPIIDFHWVEGYFTHNKLIHYMTREQNGRLVNEPQNAVEIYTDEVSFCANFDTQMRDPAIIERYKSKVGFFDLKMTVNEFPLELYLETASFNSQ